MARAGGVEPPQTEIRSLSADIPPARVLKVVPALGIEPRSRANLALAGYKSAALPLSYTGGNGSGYTICTCDLSVMSAPFCC